MNPAYYASGLAGGARERIERARTALTEGHPSTAEGILDTLLDGPYALESLTLAVTVCEVCGDADIDEMVGSAAHPDAAYVLVDEVCDLCREGDAARVPPDPDEAA